MVMKNLKAIVAGCLMLTLGGCSGQGAVTAEAQEFFPSSTAEDWVTYSDAIVNIHVEREFEIPPSADELEADEGIIGRNVSATVKEVMWRQPSRSDLAIPRSLDLGAGGWVFHGSERKELRFSGSPRLEPGHDYLIALAYTTLHPTGSGTPAWIPIGGQAIVPNDSATIGKGEDIARPGALAKSLQGRPTSDLVDKIRETAPDPKAKGLLDEPASVRRTAVQAAS
ncbi:MAG TPA: hypothetical protein P5314_06555 [Tetrasphaera sp.]|nr:hypothetical protein [Tetrasphaera sp.]